MGSKYTDAQKRATLKYFSNLVSIQIKVTPEQREKYRAQAKAQGMSLTEYIISKLEKEG